MRILTIYLENVLREGEERLIHSGRQRSAGCSQSRPTPHLYSEQTRAGGWRGMRNSRGRRKKRQRPRKNFMRELFPEPAVQHRTTEEWAEHKGTRTIDSTSIENKHQSKPVGIWVWSLVSDIGSWSR